MRGLFLILVLVVAYTCADAPKTYPEATACNSLFEPIREKIASKAILDYCKATNADPKPAKADPKAPKPDPRAATLKCIAKMNGLLLQGDDGTSTFDAAKLKKQVQEKVKGTKSQAKTQLGLDKCPASTLAAFDVQKYLICVQTYCYSGAAPAKA